MRKMWVVGVMFAVLVLFLYGVISAWDVRAESVDDWEEYIEVVCGEYGICPELVQAIIERESSWDPKAENQGCIGLMQIEPLFHRGRMERLGVTDLRDPYDNILVGVDYLAELFRRYKELYPVLMFYNAGYSEKEGLLAYEKGHVSDYAREVDLRAQEIARRNGK